MCSVHHSMAIFQSTFCKYMSATLETTVADYIFFWFYYFWSIIFILFLFYILMLINAKCFTILDWWNNLHEMISIELSTHLITCLKSSVHCLQDLYRDNTSTNNFNTQGHPVRFNHMFKNSTFLDPMVLFAIYLTS